MRETSIRSVVGAGVAIYYILELALDLLPLTEAPDNFHSLQVGKGNTTY